MYVCDKAYTKEEILSMEGTILETLEFNLLNVSGIAVFNNVSIKDVTIDNASMHYVSIHNAIINNASINNVSIKISLPSKYLCACLGFKLYTFDDDLDEL